MKLSDYKFYDKVISIGYKSKTAYSFYNANWFKNKCEIKRIKKSPNYIK